jgi:WD40 repeat protein
LSISIFKDCQIRKNDRLTALIHKIFGKRISHLSFCSTDKHLNGDILDEMNTFLKNSQSNLIELNSGHLATGHHDAKIRIWSLTTKELAQKLNGHLKEVNSLTQLKDDHILASGSCDTTIMLWNVTSAGRLLKNLTHHFECVMSLISLSDGQLLSCSLDGTIQMWTAANQMNHTIRTLVAEGNSRFLNLILLGQNSLLASGCVDGTILILSFETGRKIKKSILSGHLGSVDSLVYIRDGFHLASSEDPKIKIWNHQTGQQMRTILAGSKTRSLVVLRNKHLASASLKTIQIWNYTNGQLVDTFRGHFDWIFSLCLLKSGNLASASFDGFIKVWSPLQKYNISLTKKFRIIGKNKTSSELQETINVQFGVLRILLVKENEHLLIAGLNPTIKVFYIKTKREAGRLIGHTRNVRALAKLKKERLASGSADGSIIIWNLTSQQLIRNLTDLLLPVIDLVSFEDDENLACCVLWYRVIKICSLTSGQVTKELKGFKYMPICMVMINNSSLASGTLGEGLITMHLATGKITSRLDRLTFRVDCLILLENGFLASGSFDTFEHFVKIWNVTSDLLVNSLIGHTASVLTLFDLKNSHLASASADFTIKIWNYKNGTLLKTLLSHQDFVQALVLLENGNLLSASADGAVNIWNLTCVLRNENAESISYG